MACLVAELTVWFNLAAPPHPTITTKMDSTRLNWYLPNMASPSINVQMDPRDWPTVADMQLLHTSETPCLGVMVSLIYQTPTSPHISDWAKGASRHPLAVYCCLWLNHMGQCTASSRVGSGVLSSVLTHVHCGGNQSTPGIDHESMHQAYHNILAGAGLVLGLKLAGSSNNQTFDALGEYSIVFAKFTKGAVHLGQWLLCSAGACAGWRNITLIVTASTNMSSSSSAKPSSASSRSLGSSKGCNNERRGEDNENVFTAALMTIVYKYLSVGMPQALPNWPAALQGIQQVSHLSQRAGLLVWQAKLISQAGHFLHPVTPHPLASPSSTVEGQQQHTRPLVSPKQALSLGERLQSLTDTWMMHEVRGQVISYLKGETDCQLTPECAFILTLLDTQGKNVRVDGVVGQWGVPAEVDGSQHLLSAQDDPQAAAIHSPCCPSSTAHSFHHLSYHHLLKFYLLTIGRQWSCICCTVGVFSTYKWLNIN